MKHTKEEILNYVGCLKWLTNEMLKCLKKLEVEHEQYFGDCSIFGVDREGILSSLTKLLKDYRREQLKAVEKYQGIKMKDLKSTAFAKSMKGGKEK